MKFPPKTPPVVRRAVKRYARVRRNMLLATVAVVGLALVGLVLATFFLVDRFVECRPALRQVGPWLAVAILAGTPLAALVLAVLRRRAAATTAIQLDQAFPDNQDRWATSLDVAERLQRGEHVGDPAVVERLFSETQAHTSDAWVGSTVSRRRLGGVCAGLVLVGLLLGFMHASPAFDVALLWQRFWDPYGNLPRDSSIRITIREINSHAYDGRTIPPLPESNTFRLVVELRHKGGLFDLFGSSSEGTRPADQLGTDWHPPTLEVFTDKGIESLEAVQTNGQWVMTRPKLTESFRFRIRADDALTRVHQQQVLRRIKLSRVLHSIRFPKYSKLPPVTRRVLTARRLSVLAQSRIQFRVACDRDYTRLEATFEPFQESGSVPDAGTPDRPNGKSYRRGLRVSRSDRATGRFRLNVEESGILRIRAQGPGGLWSREHTCVVEAVPDSPPRLTITGLEPSTTIIPGELIAVRYHADDDLAVADIVMEWTVAGSFTGLDQFDLSGEEYVRSDDYGKKVVTGQEVIQRMNYKVYAAAPFKIRFVAVDSKGQETRSPAFEVHIVDDDYAARFERGMKLLEDLRYIATEYGQRVRQIENVLNILTAAVGQQTTWPTSHDKFLDRLRNEALRMGAFSLQRRLIAQRYGGLPYRLDRSTALLVAAYRARPLPGDVLGLVEQLGSGAEVGTTLRRLRQLVRRAQRFNESLIEAIEAEQNRFLPASIGQKTRRLEQRFAGLPAIRANEDLYTANLEFYFEELKRTILDSSAALLAIRGDLKPVLAALDKAHSQKRHEDVAPALRSLIRLVSGNVQPPSKALQDLASSLLPVDMQDGAGRDRFTAAASLVVRARGQEEFLQAGSLLDLARGLSSASQPRAPATAPATRAGTTRPRRPEPAPVLGARWAFMPASAADLCQLAEQFRQQLQAHRVNILAGRYDLYAQARHNREAELQERALTLVDMAARCTDVAKARKDRLVRLLTPLADGEFADSLMAPDSGLLGQLDAAAQAIGLPPPALTQTRAAADFVRLAGAMRSLADRYMRHAKGHDTVRPGQWTDEHAALPVQLMEEAQRLWADAEALEATYRAIVSVLTPARLLGEEPKTAWADWRPLHGIQLAMTMIVTHAERRVYVHQIPDSRRTPEQVRRTSEIAARNARELAADLRTFSGLVEAQGTGRPVRYDFQTLMTRSQSMGHLKSLAEEFRYVTPFMFGAGGPGADKAQTRLAKSFLGGVARAEGLLLEVLVHRRKLDGLGGLEPATVTARLKDLSPVVGALKDEELSKAHARLLRLLTAAPATAPATASPVVSRALTAFVKRLDDAITSLRNRAHLPPVNATKIGNQRERQRPGITYIWWSASNLLDYYDRRWLQQMREAELALVRELLVRSSPSPATPGSARGLILQYGRMLELRARNLANQRRRNRGIAFLQPDAGPALRLPKHIAVEFFKARNRKSPEAFKTRIEAYHDRLYRDLSR